MIYFIKTVGSPYVKIGHSTDVIRRLESLRGSCPFDLELLVAFPGDTKAEVKLHERFRDSQLHHEWFHYSKDIIEYLEHPKLLPYTIHEVKVKERKRLRDLVKSRVKYSKETSYAKRRSKSV